MLLDTKHIPFRLSHLLIPSGLGLIYVLNQILNKRVLNHGQQALFDWAQEIILVTGGSSGIGGATVQELSRKGTRVVEVAANIKREVGAPTVIVANAGVVRGKPMLDASQQDVELTFSVNTLGLIWTIKTFLPALAARNHGHLLIVASQAGYITTASGTDYCASKAAAIAIYEGIHSEIKHIYKAPAVRVSCICPSHVQTDMFKGIKFVPGMTSTTPLWIAQKITSILHSGDAYHALVPASAGIASWIRVLPNWMRVKFQDVAAAAFADLQPRDPFRKVD
ncbi:hypothetical protein AK830_g5448 [Neonectria ditissima]|uniref:Uncharacterized protein n=1 Tax=Neonectria ditissima TaxID=78410 RepID=A0A0P7BE94_9HYPO|nr:hypothetical protein AK830_g5448 [Neonectria ditissima]